MSQQHVLAAVAGCLESGAYTDLTITCGSDVSRVHKMIVCTQSDVFAAAIRFGGKETEQSNIDLPDDQPQIVKLLVQYLYTGNYGVPKYGYKFPHTCSKNCSEYICIHHECGYECRHDCKNFACVECCLKNDNLSADDILVHAKMYELADKYNVTGLKELSRTKFSTGCALHWNEDSFPVAAYHALSTTVEEDKGLRDVVSDTIAAHMQLIRKPAIEVLMRTFAGLSYGVLLRKTGAHGWAKEK